MTPRRRQNGIRAVADRAGVAVSSVSRVLSDHPDVSEEMRARVLAAAAELGYQPNAFAQSLRTGESRTVGFVVGDIANPLLSQIALGAEMTLRESGYSMLLANSGTDVAMDTKNVQLFALRRVDGLLLSLLDETVADLRTALREAEVPAVLIDRELPAEIGASAVLSDHRTGIDEAMEELAMLGHRRIALIGGDPHTRPVRERERALRNACRRHEGMNCIVRSRAYSHAHGANAFTKLLDADAPPTAVIVGGNQILPGVIEVIRRRRLKVPRDLSLVTCDEVPLSQYFEPPIAALRRDPTAMGRVAAELLLERLRGEPPDVRLLPVHFHRTASCGPPPAAHRLAS